MRTWYFFLLLSFCGLAACSVQQKIRKQADHTIFSRSELNTAHIGISIFDPEKNGYLYNHQADKYFLPASNTKLFTCYAAMKYLGDSIPGLRYYRDETTSVTWVRTTGDPTLLHPNFEQQPVLDFLRKDTAGQYYQINPSFETTALGSGWSWGDYQENYMAERSAFPVYGNLVWIRYQDSFMYIQPSIVQLKDGNKGNDSKGFDRYSNHYSFSRSLHANAIVYTSARTPFRQKQIPFITSAAFNADVLRSEIKGLKWNYIDTGRFNQLPPSSVNDVKTVYSRHTDSLLKPMMYQSDNFLAEQFLLMVSDKLLGVMSDRKVIDTLLKMNFSDLQHKPNWVDGSGLSRYNLFTPANFVKLLYKMQNEFPWERITGILPTGGTGTLNNFYKEIQHQLYAKTGTLNGQVALSGYLITRKNRKLIFSILVNNHQTTATTVRKAVESFLLNIYRKY